MLADFDKRATEILGMLPSVFETRYGSKAFWTVLQDTPDFYSSLPLMIDAPFLVEATIHLNPIILTGVPMGDWAEKQKKAWRDKHEPFLQMFCCRSKDKSNYCSPGDIIVDDRTEYRHLWEDKGGIWIHHKSAYDTLNQLRARGVLHWMAA